MRVEYADEEPSGLATMVGGLIEANLVRHPERLRLLRPAVIDLSVSDALVSISIAMDDRRVRVSDAAGANGRSHLHVRAGAADVLLLASVPLRLGLPDPLHPDGRVILRRVLSGRIKVAGLLRHPATLSRLSRLLSVVP